MPRFSKSSLSKIQTCSLDLQEIVNEAIKITDFTVLCGHRNQEEQEKAFKSGYSKARWGQSLHNSLPSRAIDIAPYPIDWNDKERFKQLAEVIKQIAFEKGINIRWGGDFKSFVDMPHFELA